MALQLKSFARLSSSSTSCALIPLRRCTALRPRRGFAAVPQASAEPQQQTEASASGGQASSSQPQPSCPFDTNYWHYSRSWPFWQQRAFIVPAGIAFVLLANLMESPGLKTTLVASIPVALIWYLSLYLVPKNFANYCNQWASTHPEEGKPRN
ncbi:hypothetical protein PLESTF_000632800 [Pleodorina starrii]|nr:hypothetical protein PLESTM_001735600 [Pleodorina starrii]GLC67997.1 hypothetical protein PLESTF_000632800 [Pleodorina starrii]